jgi:hypothetical protein
MSQILGCMTRKPGNENKFKRLAKSISKDKTRAWPGRTRKGALRAKPGSHTGRAMADERSLSPLSRFMGALSAEKIRFQLIGMSAAILQGVPIATFDVDLWIDLPARQYMRAVNVARLLGAKMVRNTIVELQDGTLVNFIFEVTGLENFAMEFRKAKKLKFHGLTIPVMPLESIRKSKAATMRPKDEAHIHYIDETLRLRKKAQ